MSKQLPLSLQLPDDASFDNFIPGDNQQLVHSLLDKQEPLIVIWGGAGSGKSHLLQALCQHYLDKDLQALYMPLSLDDDLSPEFLEGLELLDLVCLDDVQSIAGQQDWEHAMFHFFNNIRETGKRLVVAADRNAVNLAIQLPDLKSRLSWGLTYQIKGLSDAEKLQVIKLRAHSRGFDIGDEVARYLLSRVSRDLSQLLQLLEKLDYESLARQRKLTIPFIKNYL